MNAKRSAVSFILTLALITLLAGLLILLGGGGDTLAQAGTGIIRVSSTGADVPTCGSAAAPCRTVQYAVDRAAVGDQVWVAAGTYNAVNSYGGLSQVLYLTKTLTLRGGYRADFAAWDPAVYTTTLDAGGNGRVVYISGEISPTLEALVITGGRANGLGGDPFGDAGGGVYILSATVTLSHNVIIGNEAIGGGFFDDGLGGGLYATESAPILRGNRIWNNQTGGGAWASGQGGGLYFVHSRPVLEANQIRGNQAGGDFGSGGGVELAACSAFTFTNNIIADNHAPYGGSGLYVGAMSGVPSYGQLRHTTLARNRDDGVAGLRVVGGSVVTLTNTILAGHDTGINVSFGSTATLTATLWGSGAWANDSDWGDVGTLYTGTVNIWGDPAFLNPDGGDYHIAFTSAARNQGVDAGIPTDIDGEPRDDGQPDLGADEVGQQSLLIVKRASVTDLYPGETVTYTLIVTNGGSLAATNVVLTDDLPALQRPLSAPAGCTISDGGYGGRVVCTPGDLGVGQGVQITLTAQVTATSPPSLPQTMRNRAQAASDQAQNSAYADTILHELPDCHVRVNGAPPEYMTVQAGVDAASAGDEVWIAGSCVGAYERAGLYQQVYLDKNLTLRGGYRTDFAAWDPTAYPTTLDADGQGRVIYVTGPVVVTLEALRLTGGDATGLGGLTTPFNDVGGGLYAITATVTLSRVQVIGNVASTAYSGLGGGVGVTTATLTLRDAELTGNTASSAGLGLGHGGGLAAEFSTVHLERSRLAENVASAGGTMPGLGGGAYLGESRLAANATLWLSNTTSTFSDWGSGGGLYLIGSQPFTLTNCVLADNRSHDASGQSGSGLWLEGAPGLLLQPTIARNGSDEGVYVGRSTALTVTNAIIFSHTVGIRAAPTGTVTVDGVLWHANVSNTATISGTILVGHAHSGPPAFAADGYHLTSASQARDRGVVSGVADDIDGEARPLGAGYDLGADEFPSSFRGYYLPLVLRKSAP